MKRFEKHEYWLAAFIILSFVGALALVAWEIYGIGKDHESAHSEDAMIDKAWFENLRREIDDEHQRKLAAVETLLRMWPDMNGYSNGHTPEANGKPKKRGRPSIPKKETQKKEERCELCQITSQKKHFLCETCSKVICKGCRSKVNDNCLECDKVPA